MAGKKEWSWSDGCCTHRGYATKKAAVADALASISTLTGDAWALATHSLSYMSYPVKHTVSGIRSNYSQPSNGANSLPFMAEEHERRMKARQMGINRNRVTAECYALRKADTK